MAAKKFDPDQFAFELSERLKEAGKAPNIGKYKPHAKQYVFHSSPKKKKLYIGGNRSGKTTGGVTEAIWRATCRHPYRPDLNDIGPNRGRVVAVDFINGIEKIILPQYKQWIKPSMLRGGSWESAFDKFTKTLNFSNGSTIEFMSYDQDLDKFAGTSRHWVHFDEEPPKTIFVENMARLIDTDGDYWITMTPVEGMTWIYDDLYEGHIGNADSDIEIIEINTLENPYLKQSAIESFLSSVDEDETTARVGGKFVSVGGRIYKNFDPTPGVAQVLSEPFDEPRVAFKNWLWIMGLDHGLNNPTAVLWMAVDPNGFCVVFDEHYKKEWTVDQHAAEIHKKIKLHGRMPDLLVADPSIVNRNGITNTSVQQEYQKYGLSFTEGNNDVKAGLIRVKRYLNTAKYVGRRSKVVFGENTDEFHRLRITPNCPNLIWEMKKYRWKTFANKKVAYENNAYDTPQKKDDHACDALRYIIMTQPDLAADNVTLSDRLEGAMGQFEFANAATMNSIADPYGMTEQGSGWSESNSMPGGESTGGWSYDEHMGGAY